MENETTPTAVFVRLLVWGGYGEFPVSYSPAQ